MKLPLISAIALTAGLMVSGSAMAQNMFGSATLTDDELVIVQAHCDTLERLDNTGNSMSEPGPVKSDAPAGDDALVLSVNLDEITLQQCEEAGLVD